MDDSIEQYETFESDDMRRHERLRNKIRPIAAKPKIANAADLIL